MRLAYEITAVRIERTNEVPHEHVSRVRLDGAPAGSGVSRGVIVADLNDPKGRRYYVEAQGQRDSVTLATCPHCTLQHCLTTSPDRSGANRLLELERF